MRLGNKIAIAVILAAIALHFSQKSAVDPGGILPAKGMVVVMVEETSQRGTKEFPPAQVYAVDSTLVKSYLDAHCSKDDKGRPEWRLWDKDETVMDAPKPVVDAFARPHPTLPWIEIIAGRKPYEGPLPADTSSLLELLQKYGGN